MSAVPLTALDPFVMLPQAYLERHAHYRNGDLLAIRLKVRPRICDAVARREHARSCVCVCVQYCQPMSLVNEEGECHTYYLRRGSFPLKCISGAFRHGLAPRASIERILCAACPQ